VRRGHDLGVRRRDLLAQLTDALGDVDPMLDPYPWRSQLALLCETARLAFGAAACSVAEVDGDDLHYLAGAGVGSEAIVGARLAVGRGIGGFVAMTGQALAIDNPVADARFARDVADRTGYVPETLLVVPVVDEPGDVIGIVSVLDRTVGAATAFELASAFAALAAHAVVPMRDAMRTSALVLEAFVTALGDGDDELAPALRRAVARRPAGDGELAAIAATLNAVRAADPATRRRVATIVDEAVALALPRRRR
jgi:GAF domain